MSIFGSTSTLLKIKETGKRLMKKDYLQKEAYGLRRLTAFKRFRVNFESNNGCRYFFEKRSLITHFCPTNVETNTLCKEANKLLRTSRRRNYN
jgi:hypothetical protein